MWLLNSQVLKPYSRKILILLLQYVSEGVKKAPHTCLACIFVIFNGPWYCNAIIMRLLIIIMQSGAVSVFKESKTLNQNPKMPLAFRHVFLWFLMTHGSAMVFLMTLLISIMQVGAAKVYKESKMNQKLFTLFTLSTIAYWKSKHFLPWHKDRLFNYSIIRCLCCYFINNVSWLVILQWVNQWLPAYLILIPLCLDIIVFVCKHDLLMTLLTLVNFECGPLVFVLVKYFIVLYKAFSVALNL